MDQHTARMAGGKSIIRDSGQPYRHHTASQKSCADCVIASVFLSMLVLKAGVALPRRSVQVAGDLDVAAYLADWAEAYPRQVVDHGVV